MVLSTWGAFFEIWFLEVEVFGLKWVSRGKNPVTVAQLVVVVVVVVVVGVVVVGVGVVDVVDSF